MELPIRWVASFVAVYEHGHFGQAARALHLSQSAVSKHVAGLERELGAPLLVRDAGFGVRATAAGHSFVPAAQTLLAAHDSARDVVRRGERVRVLRLGVLAGVPFTAAQVGYVRAATALRTPGWDLAVHHVPFTAMLDCLLERTVDVLWTGHAPLHPQLDSVRIGRLKRFGMVGLRHPLREAGPVAAAEFAELPLLVNPALSADWMAPFCLGDLRPMKEANLVPITSNDALSVVGEVARGTGVAVTITSAPLPPALRRMVAMVELADVPPMETHAAFRAADRREVVRTVLDALVGLDLTTAFARAG